MVDEVFLQRAVQIRRSYLKIINNMEFYKKQANDVVKKLDSIISDVENLQKEIEEQPNKNDRPTAEKMHEKFSKLLENVELESKTIDQQIDPLNKEIEKLALEEQELYRQIKEKNANLSDDEIIESVRKRLEDENLS